MRIRTDDLVLITTGDDAGKTPRKVLRLLNGGTQVVVEAVNRVWKHVKRNHPKSPQGGRLSLEMPIDASNVMFFCPKCNRGTRLGARVTAEGVKERFCKKCGASAGQIGVARKVKAAAK